jgi:hypothetical protein
MIIKVLAGLNRSLICFGLRLQRQPNQERTSREEGEMNAKSTMVFG